MLDPEIRKCIRRLCRQFGLNEEPPAEVVNTIFNLLTTKAPKTRELLRVDHHTAHELLKGLVIAYGIGWLRIVSCYGRGNHGSWSERWRPAVNWAEEQVFQTMRAVVNVLTFQWTVHGFDAEKSEAFSPTIAEDIVRSMIDYGGNSAPTIGTSPLGAGKPQARTAKWLLAHSIDGWNPCHSSFQNFLAQAVKGSLPHQRGGMIAASALTQSLYWPYLYTLAGMRYAKILFRLCREDGTRVIEGLNCPECIRAGRSGQGHAEEWHFDQERFVVPDFEGGPFRAEHWWRCPVCTKRLRKKDDPPTNFFPEDVLVCPQCKTRRAAGMKRSRVYVLVPHGQICSLSTVPIATLQTSDDDFDERSVREKIYEMGQRRILALLEGIERTVFLHHFYKAESLVKIARDRGISEEQADATYQSGIRRIRDHLINDDGEPL